MKILTPQRATGDGDGGYQMPTMQAGAFAEEPAGEPAAEGQ